MDSVTCAYMYVCTFTSHDSSEPIAIYRYLGFPTSFGGEGRFAETGNNGSNGISFEI